MRFLADECCDFGVVRALRTAGHDVVSVSHSDQGSDDAKVIERAMQEERILLTEDKDFGQFVFAHGHNISGVIFLRYPSSVRRQIAEQVVELIDQRGEQLAGCFVTVQIGRIRISHVPEE